MELLKILTDGRLPREKSKTVVFGVDQVETLAKNMFYTMKMSGGVGLAAPQIGQLLRIITIDTTPAGGQFMGIMINPLIVNTGDDVESHEEGCLSFPGKQVRTKRMSNITVEFQDFQGNKKTRKFNGIDAICIQHEVDHLNGITMFEREVNGLPD